MHAGHVMHAYIHTYIHAYITYIDKHALHYMTVQYITIQYVTLHYITPFHYIALHYIRLHYKTYRIITLHCKTYLNLAWHHITYIGIIVHAYKHIFIDHTYVSIDTPHIFMGLNNPNAVGQSTAGAFNILRPDRMLLRLHSLKDIFWGSVSRLGIFSLETDSTARFPTRFTMEAMTGSLDLFCWGKAGLARWVNACWPAMFAQIPVQQNIRHRNPINNVAIHTRFNTWSTMNNDKQQQYSYWIWLKLCDLQVNHFAQPQIARAQLLISLEINSACR
jgi:hypothetical protein